MDEEILVIGSLNMDLSIRVKDMPLVGETIIGESVKYIAGGKGANQAQTIGKLKGKVRFLGAIGDDAFGKVQIETLSRSGVDCSRFKINKELSTGIAVIYVDAKGNNNIVVIPEANSSLDIRYIEENREVLKNSKYILLQMEIPYKSVVYAIEEAKKLGKIVILNPAPAMHIDDEVLKNIDYITPNETELMKLSNMPCNTKEEIVKAAKILLEKGVKNIITTLGENGVALVNSDGVKFFEAVKVKAVDTTAAGDCFNGAFVCGLSKGLNMDKAIEFAMKAAGISVTREGAMSSLPTLEEVEKYRI